MEFRGKAKNYSMMSPQQQNRLLEATNVTAANND